MGLPEHREQFPIGDLLRIEDDEHGLGVPGSTATNLLIGRVRCEASRVADCCRVNAVDLPEYTLSPPEAAETKDRRPRTLGERWLKGRPEQGMLLGNGERRLLAAGKSLGWYDHLGLVATKEHFLTSSPSSSLAQSPSFSAILDRSFLTPCLRLPDATLWERSLCKLAPLRGLSGCREFLSGFPLIPKRLLGLALELPDPLAGDRKLLAQISEGSWLLVVKAVAADEDAALALGEPLDGLHNAARLQLPQHLADHPRFALVLDKIAQLRALLRGGELLVEASGVWYGALHVLDPIDVPADPLRNLSVGRLTLELGPELVVDSGHLPYLLAHVHGHPYGPPFVGDRPLDGLPDPPGGVGGEAEALLGVELVCCSHEAYVALLDEVSEG